MYLYFVLFFSAEIEYEIKSLPSSSVPTKVYILNANDEIVAENDKLNGSITISNPKLWWPYSEDLKNPGYQYTLMVSRLELYILLLMTYFL